MHAFIFADFWQQSSYVSFTYTLFEIKGEINYLKSTFLEQIFAIFDLSSLGLLTAVNCRAVKLATKVQDVFSVTKVCTLLCTSKSTFVRFICLVSAVINTNRSVKQGTKPLKGKLDSVDLLHRPIPSLSAVLSSPYLCSIL